MQKESEEILLDLLEGFYPKMMETNFPDGVFFEIEDMMEICYENNQKISKEDFLRKIPKQFISKNGDVVHVRKNLNQFFRGRKSSIDGKKRNGEFDLDFCENLKKTLKESKFFFNLDNDCKLKIRDGNGKNYFVELNSGENLEFLYMKIGEIFKGKFFLEINYPKKVLDKKVDGRKNMNELGLAPQSLLLLKYI